MSLSVPLMFSGTERDMSRQCPACPAALSDDPDMIIPDAYRVYFL
jgi:hypothetical protein